MSICFVLVKKEQVVCTQQGKPGARGRLTDAPLTGPAPGRAGASATPAQGVPPMKRGMRGAMAFRSALVPC